MTQLVERLTGDRRVADSNLAAGIVTVYVSLSAVTQLVERLTGDRRVADSRLAAGEVTVLCPLVQ